MKSTSSCLTFLPFAALCLLGFIQSVVAQINPLGESKESRAALMKLSPPIYPELSRQARITGDVRVKIELRPDGTVDTTEVVDGHPILSPAVLESIQKSTFECRNCKEETTLVLTYSFRLRDTGDCTLLKHLRSAKCLYFWKCGGWRSTKPKSIEITQSPDRITILADPPCPYTNYSRSAGN